jgi:hypothetical protein
MFKAEYHLGHDFPQSKNDLEEVIRVTEALEHFLHPKISQSKVKWALTKSVDRAGNRYSPEL